MSLLDAGAISVCRQPFCDCPAVGRDRSTVLPGADLLSGDLRDVWGTSEIVGCDVLAICVVYENLYSPYSGK